ncbi:MAG: 1-deoxy-D-xylulose-5-phosphate reductoisomerase [Candidatus Pelagibacter sp.]
MMKKIAILGSTGSIGETTLKIIKKDKKNFKINLLTTNRNINKIFKQAKDFRVKNIIISDLSSYKKAKIKFKRSNINIYNSFDSLNKIIKTKNDLVMSSITGLNGLLPTLKSIKHTKKILIANKESIICGWNLINKELKKYNTNFVPVDSEHFSIWSLLQNYNSNDIDKIFITASGGPFLKLPKKKFSNISVKKALNHPNWSMGKKITIDSATLMNKVFEVIEAKNIFNLDYDKISILTHPKSYLHAITKFKNGLTKLLLHDPDMKIPIYNSIYTSNVKSLKTPKLNFKILNNLELRDIDTKKFPLVKLLDKLPSHSSLYETILITVNDYLVFKFLDKKINFQKLINLINRISNFKEFQKFKKIKPKSIDDIYELRDYVSLKLDSLGI